MKSFLTYVAEDIIKKYGTNLSDIVVVFPNKRASLFLNDSLARLSQHPLWSPTYITISDLFRKKSALQIGDPIKLICDLHQSFVTCTGILESLDHFYGWGQLLLSDFDDIDKNMVDAGKLFANLRDLHELDDLSYLTEEQKRYIQKFFSNFTDNHNSELKKRFLQLWSHFSDIYNDFNHRLAEQGIAYEGALYKKVVMDESLLFTHKKYLFVGFNMMQKVEHQLLDRLKQEGKAAFYWDYDDYYMKETDEAGHYIRQYLAYYPNELGDYPQEEIYHQMGRAKDVTYVSAATENIQARYVRTWLLENNRYQAGRNTAIVLADESLLQAVIHSLPEEIESVNITVGFPLQQTPFFSLIQHLVNLQTKGKPKSNAHSSNKVHESYRLHFVNLVLRHPYACYISDKYLDLIKNLEEERRFYPTRESLCLNDDEGLTLLFKDLEATDNYNLALMTYLIEILKHIGIHAKGNHDPLFQEALFRTYTLMNRLRNLIESGDLAVDIVTLERIIQQVIQSTSIPFHGEPIEGIQIMGVLETRNLDFEHILVLSCTEGNLPKGVNDSSFIPYSLRKAYDLTTIDNKVAIYAYYFHRMIQRASDITLTYNNATDDGHKGEMSRFMLQMLVEYKHLIQRKALVAGQIPIRSTSEAAIKSPDVMKTLGEFGTKHLITPTFLNTYLRCPKRFFYKYIEGLQEPNEQDEDEIDNRIFGNIFHRAAQLFYLKFAQPSDLKENAQGEQELIHPITISKGELEYALKHDEIFYQLVDEAFRIELFKTKNSVQKTDYNGLQLINREVITSYLKQLITIDQRLAPFTILGLEMQVEQEFKFATLSGSKKLRLGGFIDRLDEISTNGTQQSLIERIRIIDYKTGRMPQSFPKDVESLFSPEELSKHTDYYLQALLYSIIVRQNNSLNPANMPVSPALIFIQKAGSQDYDPTLNFGSDPIIDAASYQETFMEGLNQLVYDIFNPNLPFTPTEETDRCNTCPYAQLCKGGTKF